MPAGRTLHALSIGAIACLSATAGETQQRPASSTFRAGTTLVEIDTVVTDRQGKFVANLKPADFQLTVDGRPAPIDALYLVLGNRLQNSQPDPAVDRSAVTPPALVTDQLLILFFDTGHMNLAPLGRARDAAIAFLQTVFRTGDTAGIVADGAVFLSQDRPALIDAVRRIRPDGDFLPGIRPEITPDPRSPIPDPRPPTSDATT